VTSVLVKISEILRRNGRGQDAVWFQSRGRQLTLAADGLEDEARRFYFTE
jgi:hypothetical protein